MGAVDIPPKLRRTSTRLHGVTYSCKTKAIGANSDHVHKATHVHSVAIEVNGRGGETLLHCAISGNKNAEIG
jgi:hypothetical protein